MANRPIGRRRPVGSSGEAPPEPVEASGTPAAAEGDAGPTEDGLAEDGLLGDEPSVETDAIAEPVGETNALPRRLDSWRRRSATGAILTGFAFGLQEVFDQEKKDPAIVMETSGEPPRDLPVEAELEAASRRSVVRIRPWLLDEEPDAGESDEPAH